MRTSRRQRGQSARVRRARRGAAGRGRRRQPAQEAAADAALVLDENSTEFVARPASLQVRPTLSGMIFPERPRYAMANPNHLEILRKGVRHWNESKENAPETVRDLSSADFTGLDLRGANFTQDDLSFATLRGADLREADLTDANLLQADLRDADFTGAVLRGADIRHTPASAAKFIGANLIRAQLEDATLVGADLQGALLIGADFMGADLRHAVLIGANLCGADLRCSFLAGAVLMGADLTYADLTDTELEGTDVTGIGTVGESLETNCGASTRTQAAATRWSDSSPRLVTEAATNLLNILSPIGDGPSALGRQPSTPIAGHASCGAAWAIAGRRPTSSTIWEPDRPPRGAPRPRRRRGGRPPARSASPTSARNPAVVLAAAERVPRPAVPLICLEGQPASAARRLLDALAEAGIRLRYHGDFDWPGLRIANLVMERHAAEPWRYDAATYERVDDARPSGPALVGERVEASWDARLASSMTERGRAVHEEAMLTATGRLEATREGECDEMSTMDQMGLFGEMETPKPKIRPWRRTQLDLLEPDGPFYPTDPDAVADVADVLFDVPVRNRELSRACELRDLRPDSDWLERFSDADAEIIGLYVKVRLGSHQIEDFERDIFVQARECAERLANLRSELLATLDAESLKRFLETESRVRVKEYSVRKELAGIEFEVGEKLGLVEEVELPISALPTREPADHGG